MSRTPLSLITIAFLCVCSATAQLMRHNNMPHNTTTSHHVTNQHRTILNEHQTITRRTEIQSFALSKTLLGHTDYINALSYNHDKSRIVSASRDNTVNLWDAENGGPPLQTFEGQTRSKTWSVSYNRDGSRFAAGYNDGTIEVWDAEDGGNNTAPLQSIPAHTDKVMSLAYNHDGSRCASGSSDGTIKVWNAENEWVLLQTLTEHTADVRSVAYNHDGSRIVSGSDDLTIKVCNAENGVLLQTFTGHTQHITSAAYNHDGSRIVSGSKDNSIKVWNTNNDGSLIKTLTGHDGTVWSVAYNHDGSRIVSGAKDMTIIVWDPENIFGAPLQTLTGHTDTVSSVAYSHDGLRIVSGSHDQTIRVWERGCPLGSVLDTSNEKCVPCSKGTYYDGTTCTNCPAGNFQALEGQTSCNLCPAGTYQPMEGSITDVDCIPCKAGAYQPNEGSTMATDCIACAAGTYQPNEGGTRERDCISCNAGSFQFLMGQPKCNECPAGSYQSLAGQSGCDDCPAGFYQSLTGQSSECDECKAGTYQSLRGQSSCSDCRAGGYCPKRVATGTCGGGFKPCPFGTYNNDTGKNDINSCLPCPEGTYSDSRSSLLQCSQCPHRLGSSPNSITCPFCAEGFYLKVPNISAEEINMNPAIYCLACPADVTCIANTTIETLKANSNSWRLSNDTCKFYRCEHSNGCQGDTSCAKGYCGILCEKCTDKRKYFNSSDGTCTNCPFERFGIVAGIFAGCILFILIGKYVSISVPNFDLLAKFSTFLTSISIQAKLKIIISFFQVIITLEPIYGVHMHSAFTKWFSFLQIFNFGLVEALSIPNSCYGSMKTRLYINAGWPYAFVLLLVGGIFLHTVIVDIRKLNRKDIVAKILSRSLHATIIVFYLVLPSVSRGIFDSITCQSFMSNDTDNISHSYLRSDWKLQCDGNDPAYASIKSLFWVLFAAWPVAVPLGFLGLLLFIRPSVRTNRITPLAEACRFLWRDYESSTMFWEFIDVMRKICLTGLIIFIDSEDGSDGIFRLLLGIVICVVYGLILSRARPYKRNDDLDLAIFSNLLLTCCFVVGIIIHQCKEEDDDLENNTCEKLFGLHFNSHKATLTAVILTASMLLIFVLFLLVLGVNAIGVPTIRIINTNNTPHLELASDCNHHLFFSHIWKSGQGNTHKIVRMLQLYLPGIKIWLDIDSLTNVKHLEESVVEAARFVIFYSKGYFTSKNCVRELKTAVENGKPITIIFENDHNLEDARVIQNMRKECRENLPAEVDSIFAEEPILWLNTSLQFSVESVKIIVGRLLQKLPYYKEYPFLLHDGLKIYNELGPVKVLSPLKILFCSANEGVRDIASKLCKECEGTVEMNEMNLFESPGHYDGIARVMLLYLNHRTFLDKDNLLRDSVKISINQGIPVFLVHEKNASNGGCPFEKIMSQTPDDLQTEPFDLYSHRIAVSLYSAKEYEQVSLRQVLRNMGAMLTDTDSNYHIT